MTAQVFQKALGGFDVRPDRKVAVDSVMHAPAKLPADFTARDQRPSAQAMGVRPVRVQNGVADAGHVMAERDLPPVSECRNALHGCLQFQPDL